MSKDLPTILKSILESKREEVIAQKKKYSLEDVVENLKKAPRIRPFKTALLEKVEQGLPAVIAEIKKGSPSKGILCERFEPQNIALSYEEANACCISVLTDSQYFYGSDNHLSEVRAVSSLPILRKDFVIDEYQIYHSRMIGADCILLICSALDQEKLVHFNDIALSLQMDVLVEVHDISELEVALSLEKSIIGINNRNLHTFEESLDITFNLINKVPEGRIVVTESGIRSKEDVIRMRERNVNAFLVGEAFMRAENPGEEVKRLFF